MCTDWHAFKKRNNIVILILSLIIDLFSFGGFQAHQNKDPADFKADLNLDGGVSKSLNKLLSLYQ